MRKPLATRLEVAEYLGVPVATLDRWAHHGTGPAYRKIGRHTRYRWEDVETWIEQQAAGGTGQARPA
ncbi:AlpA family transcriptional regulator [Pseudonocardia sp. MH-G8]|uniref:helix-turn-helix transcriptional regulator n=1 Tax=Pseudonocardia sp. MH-G8 TaxID=1854588 RepID=UPI0018E90D4C|nr:helix-turn-helix domain-containing protein [Pseudonocardia sp. MH-G8]